jgi:hypothetical protein
MHVRWAGRVQESVFGGVGGEEQTRFLSLQCSTEKKDEQKRTNVLIKTVENLLDEALIE